MNEMTEVERLWDEVPEATRQDLAGSRARLMTEMTRGRRRTRVWSLRGAVLVAGAVVAVQIGGGLTGNGPPANAADLLERAALAAAEQPDLTPRPDQYIHTELRTTRMITRLDTSQQIFVPYQEERWESAGAGRPWLLRERGLDPKLDRGVDDVVYTTSCDTGSADVLTTAQLAHWPTDPAKLRPLVEREAAKATAIPAGERMWGELEGLIRQSAFRPDLTAALYRLAAELKGITLVDDAVDSLGRPGIAVAFRYDGLRSELIFDRDTYRFLGSRTVATKDRKKIEKVPARTPEQIEEAIATMVKFGDTPEEARKNAEEMRKDREFVVTTPKGTVTDSTALVGIGLADGLPPLSEKVSRVTVPC
ncbi:CU044_5270 family protein [Herbidospora sp. RD11066]